MPHRLPEVGDDPLPTMSAAGAAPCPFCGGTADHGSLHVMATAETEEGDDVWSVTCGCCACYGPLADTSVEAVTLWNERCVHLESCRMLWGYIAEDARISVRAVGADLAIQFTIDGRDIVVPLARSAAPHLAAALSEAFAAATAVDPPPAGGSGPRSWGDPVAVEHVHGHEVRCVLSPAGLIYAVSDTLPELMAAKPDLEALRAVLPGLVREILALRAAHPAV